MLMGLVIYIIAKRRRSQSDQVYNVEAAQVDGPPTIIATEYNRTSGGLSGVYSSGPNEQGNKQDNSTEPGKLGPTHPVPSYQSDRPPTYTAPVSQVRFADQQYPFSYDAVSYMYLPTYRIRCDSIFWAEKRIRTTEDCLCHGRIPSTTTGWK